jgi:hypothetical protein
MEFEKIIQDKEQDEIINKEKTNEIKIKIEKKNNHFYKLLIVIKILIFILFLFVPNWSNYSKSNAILMIYSSILVIVLYTVIRITKIKNITTKIVNDIDNKKYNILISIVIIEISHLIFSMKNGMFLWYIAGLILVYGIVNNGVKIDDALNKIIIVMFSTLLFTGYIIVDKVDSLKIVHKTEKIQKLYTSTFEYKTLKVYYVHLKGIKAQISKEEKEYIDNNKFGINMEFEYGIFKEIRRIKIKNNY